MVVGNGAGSQAAEAQTAAEHPVQQGLLPFVDSATPEPQVAAERNPAEIEGLLGQRLGTPVAIEFHRSAQIPVRVTRHGPARRPTRFRLRLHRAFAMASDRLLDDLAAWTRNGKRARHASERLDDFIATAIRPQRRPPPLRPAGAVHDLTALTAPLLQSPLLPPLPAAGRELPELTWTPARRSRARSSLQLGCYDPEQHRIRIHPVLDSAVVPPWFLEVLLHHELLHALLPIERGRRGGLLHHGPEFRSWESRHPRKGDALDWEQRHIRAMLRDARLALPLQTLPIRSGTLQPSRATVLALGRSIGFSAAASARPSKPGPP